jgi:hypothetical protein
MKTEASKLNPLEFILELFPYTDPKPLTVDQSNQFVHFLRMGGTICDSQLEEVEALKLLDTLGLLTVEIETSILGTTLKVGNKYNGK